MKGTPLSLCKAEALLVLILAFVTGGVPNGTAKPSQPAFSASLVAYSFGDAASTFASRMGAGAGTTAKTLSPRSPSVPLARIGTGFTYQGSLKNGGNPASGQYHFVFTL